MDCLYCSHLPTFAAIVGNLQKPKLMVKDSKDHQKLLYAKHVWNCVDAKEGHNDAAQEGPFGIFCTCQI